MVRDIMPEDTDLTFLKGKELEQVQIVGRYQLRLMLHGGSSISIMCRAEHRSKGKTSVWDEIRPPAICSALALLGSSIVAVNVRAKETLVLTFSNKDTLTI